MAENLKLISSLVIGGEQYEIKDAWARERIELVAGSGVRYIGKTETKLVDGSAVVPVIAGLEAYAPMAGDLVIYVGVEPAQEFIWSGDRWDLFGNHGELGELAYKDQVEGQLDWTHNHTINYSEEDINVSGATAGVAVNDINYKPEGSIGIGSGAVNYTPAGSVTLGGEQDKDVVFGGNVADAVVDAHDYTPAGTVAVSVADNENGNYQPKGTINELNFTGSQATIEHEAHNHTGAFAGKAISLSAHKVTQGTVSGDIAAAFDGTEATLEVKGQVGLDVALKSENVQLANGLSLTKAANSDVASYAGEVLTLDFTSLVKGGELTYAGKDLIVGLDRANATFTGEDIVYKPAGTVTGTFSGVTAGVAIANHDQITPEGTITIDQATVAAHTYTPAGTIDKPVFTGTRAMIGATFAGTQASLKHAAHNHGVGELTGKVAVPTTATFAGTGVNLVFNGVQATLKHTVVQGTVTAAGKYQKAQSLEQAGKNDAIICK